MQNYYYIRLNFILSIHKLSNFPNNKLHFNNQQNQSYRSKQFIKLTYHYYPHKGINSLNSSNSRIESRRILNPRSILRHLPLVRSPREIATNEMDAGSVRSNAHRRRTSCPKDRPLGRYFPRRPGIIYRGVYARACVCVSSAITQNPGVFCFREIDGDHGDRIGY